MNGLTQTLKINTLNVLLLLTIASLSAQNIPAPQLTPQDYLINEQAGKTLRNQNALTMLDQTLNTYPEFKKRLLDRTYTIPDENWGYYDQAYEHETTMRHLIAKQIKAMAERREVNDIDDIFDLDYGIGSKSHKDKGTINNVFSIWGHPVREEILSGSTASTKTVYELFRQTIKNDLKAYARSQTLEWHKQSVEQRTQAALKYLHDNHPGKTYELKQELEKIELKLETLIRRTLETNLLS